MNPEIIRKYTNEASRFMVIKDRMVHYRVEGNGKPLLLLHGAFSSLHTYDGWTSELKDKFQVIRLDMPGFGLSDTPTEETYTIEYFLEFIREFLARLEVDACFMGGSSLGGWMAWEFALRYPERVNRLILIGSAGFMDDKSIPLPFKMARTPLFKNVVRLAIRRGMFDTFLKQVYSDEEKITPELADRYFDLFTREGNPKAFIRMVNSKFKDNTRKLPHIYQPTLILWGKDDNWLPLENAYRFHHALPNSELIIYEGLGHIPMEEDPYLTALDAWAFLSRPENLLFRAS
ncbi:MAG: alpha/beta hydrolase [Bacteroidota bacterium]